MKTVICLLMFFVLISCKVSYAGSCATTRTEDLTTFYYSGRATVITTHRKNVGIRRFKPFKLSAHDTDVPKGWKVMWGDDWTSKDLPSGILIINCKKNGEVWVKVFDKKGKFLDQAVAVQDVKIFFNRPWAK